MMRHGFSLTLMAALLSLVGVPRDAHATVTFDLVWVATTGAATTGSNAIDAVAGDILSLEIRMTNDEVIGGYGVSINYDTDLGNELNLVGAGEWTGITFGSGIQTTFTGPASFGVGPPPPVESTGSNAGRINTYEGGQISGPLFVPNGTYVIGTARFQVTSAVSTDGSDLFTGLFNTGVDTVLGNGFIPVSNLVFNTASVNVPEPGTASLLGLGLGLVGLGIVCVRRRSRRRA